MNGAGRADARDPVEADTVGRAASAKVEIGAAIAADGTAIVLGVKPTTAPASLPTRGPYTVAAEDGTGRELAHITAGTSAVADSGDQMLDVVLPVPTGTTKVVMSRGARVLATELRPAQVPRVHFVSPTRSTPLAVNKPVKVMWVVTGGARDRLTYEIDLSTDGGRDWRLLEYGTTAKSLTLPPGILDPSKRARLRVIANDGFDDVSAISKPLKIH